MYSAVHETLNRGCDGERIHRRSRGVHFHRWRIVPGSHWLVVLVLLSLLQPRELIESGTEFADADDAIWAEGDADTREDKQCK